MALEQQIKYKPRISERVSKRFIDYLLDFTTIGISYIVFDQIIKQNYANATGMAFIALTSLTTRAMSSLIKPEKKW